MYQKYLMDVLNLMYKNLQHEWLLSIHHKQSSRNQPFRVGHKPLLVFTKGNPETLFDNPSDTIKTDKRKRLSSVATIHPGFRLLFTLLL